MVRTFILTDKQRKAVEEYLDKLPEKMPGTIKVIRHKLAKTDLVQMGLDLELLKMLKGMEIPIGRSKGTSWSDQRGKFVVRRPKAESEETK